MRLWFSTVVSDRSAGRGLSISGLSANLRPSEVSVDFALHALVACGLVKLRLMEPATWSISASPSNDLAKDVLTSCLLLLSLSWVWLAMLFSKVLSCFHTVTAPVRPNRIWRKPQTDTTHVTLSLKSGCYFAAAFCAPVLNTLAHQRCTSGARAVHTNHTPFFEVSAC